jgi:Tol biopolymer transport system component/DNA-binding winged helix-turn-helix (wHTH) protein
MSLFINHFYRFGEFTLDTDQRVLLRQGKPLGLSPKIFETLMILVENNGRIVEREELMNRLWPDTFVEEANLSFSIQQLRKFLGDNARNPVYIETVARRGYRFIANVEEVLSDSAGMMTRSVSRRFETLDAESGDGSSGLKAEIAAEAPPPVPLLATQNDPGTAAARLDEPPATREAWTSVRKVSIATAAAMLLLVTSGLFFWRLSTSPGKNRTETVKDDRGLATQPLNFEKLTGTGKSNQVAISPDGKYIAYTNVFDEKSDIWLRQLATNTNVEIVPTNTTISGLAFTNNGEFIYFVAGRPNYDRGDPTALYRVSMLGGVTTKIIDNVEGNFAISMDDSQIAFIRETVSSEGQRQYSLMIANIDGSNERSLLVKNHPEDLDALIWSPDNQSVICSCGSSEGGSQSVKIIRVNVTDGVTQELSPARFFHITKMAWLADKSGLIILAAKNIADNQLWRVSYPGFEIRQITSGFISYADLNLAANADEAVASQLELISDLWVGASNEPQNLHKVTQAIDGFCWTKDGQLVFSSTASGNRDLWIAQPNGAGQRQLTVNAKTNGTPAVSPDNGHIVFMSNRTGSFQVWRMNLDGSDQVQLTSGSGKNFPAISADGKWVLYNTTDDWQLWKVPIDGGEPVHLSEYAAGYPAVSPDGATVACQGRTQSRTNLLILTVENGRPVKTIDITEWKPSGFRMQWTPDGKNLIYATQRRGERAIIKQPLGDGPVQKTLSLNEDDLFDFGYSPDGQKIAVTRGHWQHDIVLIKDLKSH